MKISFGHLVVMSLLWDCFEASIDDVSLTVDGSSESESDLLCPEVVTFTCVAINLDSTVLRWSHDEEASIGDLNYVYDNADVYPLVLNMPSAGFLNLTIRSASFDGEDLSNFTTDLLVDMEVIYFGLGYRSLQCGSLTVKRNFTFLELDIEAPPAHEIEYVSLIYSLSSPAFFEQLDVLSARQLYSNDNCQYRSNTSFNVTLSLDGVPQDSTSVPIDRSICSISHCLISVPQPSEADLLNITAVNRFNETPFTPPQVDLLVPSAVPAYFNLSLTYTDECSTLVECDILQGLPISTCSVRYGTDSSYSEESQETSVVPTNTPTLLDGLKESTMYYVEAVFTVNDATEVRYHWRTTHMTEENICRRNQQMTVVIAVLVSVVVVLLLVVVIAVIAIVVLVCKYRTKSLTYEDATNVEAKNVVALEVKRESETTDCVMTDSTEPYSEDPYALRHDFSVHRLPGADDGQTVEGQIQEDNAKGHMYEDIEL